MSARSPVERFMSTVARDGMKLAIDSYCYHRWFGEVYPNIENDPGSRITMIDFLDRAAAHRVEGVSLESCFFPGFDGPTIDAVRDRCETLGFARVWAWGHPHGLRSGTDRAALDDLIAHIAIAERIGAKVMRICCGGRRSRPSSWPAHRAAILPMLERAVAAAEEQGIVLAIENHIDFLADELVEVIETIGSPHLGVCLDTGNNLRILEDPMVAARKLVPYARATHIKDVAARTGDPHEFSFWPSVPLGRGLIDIGAIVGWLRGAGYDGLLALEIDFLHPDYRDIEFAIGESLDHLRGLLAPAPQPALAA